VRCQHNSCDLPACDAPKLVLQNIVKRVSYHKTAQPKERTCWRSLKGHHRKYDTLPMAVANKIFSVKRGPFLLKADPTNDYNFCRGFICLLSVYRHIQVARLISSNDKDSLTFKLHDFGKAALDPAVADQAIQADGVRLMIQLSARGDQHQSQALRILIALLR